MNEWRGFMARNLKVNGDDVYRFLFINAPLLFLVSEMEEQQRAAAERVFK